jgi:hypothetical protein
LVEAGPNGITALEMSNWALMLGHYVWELRHKYGLDIKTIDEAHGGDFPGHHGRYFLRSQVEILDDGREAA